MGRQCCGPIVAARVDVDQAMTGAAADVPDDLMRFGVE
jgi:hypothetical protein